MERYKKRTIALCLASMLTVVGAFGAENYKNSLMELKINVGSGGYVKLTAFTQKPYKTPIKTTRVDENTFVITLKDTNSNASPPDIENYENIKSIKISTYPYTTEEEGCTRILVKTNGEPILTASHALFIPDNLSSQNQEEDDDEEEEEITEENTNVVENNKSDSNTNKKTEKIQKIYSDNNVSTKTPIGASEYMTILMCILILLLIIIFIFKFSKQRMTSVVGDNNELKLDDNKNKQSKTKSIKSAIKKLDEKYSDKMTYSDLAYNNTKIDEDTTENSDKNEEEQQQNIVDLDALFNESQKTLSEPANEPENDNDDLAELLNSFMFESEKPKEPEEEPFDEDFYNKVINSNINFSNPDIQKINDLIQIEISDETIAELNKYLNTPVIKPPSEEQILAELISTYSINQNISFSHEDVSAIRKLMNVELGEDFTKDFTTNPARTKIVEKEIKENTGKPHKTSEIITLKVKDLLPDLSKELIKQGGKAIKSEVKPSVVYFSEGYEYKTLHVSDDFSKISANGKQNEYKPSYEAPIVASGYEVSTLAIKDELPDLADVKANPKKYETKTTEKKKADEQALLKSLSNVTFKPFYEEVENEMNQFDNFEIINPDEKDIQHEEQYYQTESSPSVPDLSINKESNNSDDNAKKLLMLIEAQQIKREIKKQNTEDSAAFKKELESAVTKNKKQTDDNTPKTYNYNGERVKILQTVKVTKNSECKILFAEDKYIIMGNIDDKEIVLKEYTSLNNCKMYIRLNDKTDKTKFLVKVGEHKFIILVTEDNMEFAMDLC